MSINIDFYDENTDKLTKEYDSLSFKQVHGEVLELLPKEGYILDVGCGSGRDSFYLAKQGFKVIAIDPSKEMLKHASETHKHENITWQKDSMPSLDNVKKLGIKFDFILLSAVWMHVPEKDRKAAFKNLQSLMKSDAKMVIPLRHGAFSDERKEIPVSIEELSLFSEDFNIQSRTLSANSEDALKRSSVTWESVCITNTVPPKIKRKIKKERTNKFKRN